MVNAPFSPGRAQEYTKSRNAPIHRRVNAYAHTHTHTGTRAFTVVAYTPWLRRTHEINHIRAARAVFSIRRRRRLRRASARRRHTFYSELRRPHATEDRLQWHGTAVHAIPALSTLSIDLPFLGDAESASVACGLRIMFSSRDSGNYVRFSHGDRSRILVLLLPRDNAIFF